MRFLFLHPNYPSQHGPFAAYLAQAGHEVVFLTNTDRPFEIPGVKRIIYKLTRPINPKTHAYLHGFENAVLHGQSAFRVACQLRNSGFVPDAIIAHAGWGTSLYMKDAFPKTPLLSNFEWFYKAHGSDCDFDPSDTITIDDVVKIRTRNATLLLDLTSSDAGISPTHWQKSQFPTDFHERIDVMHEGINTEFYKPLDKPTKGLVLPSIGLNLSGVKEIVTYVSRGLEPYRGFPQFIATTEKLVRDRPNCHVVIVGEDRVAYGKSAPEGQTFKSLMLAKHSLPADRVHFTDRISFEDYRRVLHASSAHVYLTRPFVLSWSSMEAMSTGCLLIGSNTPPVKEVVQHGHNGLLVDFFDTEAIANTIGKVLDRPKDFVDMRKQARATILESYQINDLFLKRKEWIFRHLG